MSSMMRVIRVLNRCRFRIRVAWLTFFSWVYPFGRYGY